MTGASKNAVQLASGGAVLAGPLLVLRSQTYAFKPQFARIFSKKDAHNIFLMTVLILHHFPLRDYAGKTPAPTCFAQPKGDAGARPGFFFFADLPRAVAAPRIEATAAGIRRCEPG